MAGIAPWARMKSATGFHARACAWDQIPASHGVMRPSGVTPLASTHTTAAPPTARLPRWTKCQSFGIPSTDEYWHMGETRIRLGRTSERSEEHTSELQSQSNLVCRLLLEKKKKKKKKKIKIKKKVKKNKV